MRIVLFAAVLLSAACSGTRTATPTSTVEVNAPVVTTPAAAPDFEVPFTRFELDNGLDVVLHQDHSDPVVAVALAAHVGSAREKPGRTGFAHLFEHLLFLESENLGKGGLDAMSARIGGSGANGFTTRDQTNYYQTVPADALEKMLWAEADKLGWFINTVSEPVLAKEKEVVKNEKRQGVDNRPYGHERYVINRNLYPEGHPYNWNVIGSLDDLEAATLEDVKEFFRRWYVPNNVTLVVAGDFEEAEAKRLVERYFAEIPRGEEVKRAPAQPAKLTATVRRSHEDNFARLPQLTRVWPTVPQYHPDSYPLQVLANYLTDGKAAPLYQALVEQAQLTSRVRGGTYEAELAGEWSLSVRAFDGIDLDRVASVMDSTLMSFGESGIPVSELERIQAGQETRFYGELSSVIGKAFQLAQYNTFAGDPGFAREELKRILAVTPADVLRVYQEYIANQPYVETSFVPQGQLNLAVEGASRASVVEEEVVAGAESAVDASAQAEYERTPSSFDRATEPHYGAPKETPTPEVYDRTLLNGMRVLGIANSEVPVVNFQLRMDGGVLLEASGDAQPGTANMLARLMNRGTAKRTPLELENALSRLGAEVDVYATRDAINVRGTTLARNYEATMGILTEMLLEPRWDAAELELIRREIVSRLQQQQAEPNAIAGLEFRRLVFGEDDVRARNLLGEEATVAKIKMDDLKDFYARALSPKHATFHIVGDKVQAAALAPLSGLIKGWTADKLEWAVPEDLPMPEAAGVYFYDVPDAKQSIIRVGFPGLTATDKDFYPAEAMNFILGGGGFASRLTQELREGKGYTYGIGSRFNGDTYQEEFSLSTGVRTNVTTEAALAIQEILRDFATTYTAEDLATTQSSLIKGAARASETAGAKLNMLAEISAYDYPVDYLSRRQQEVRDLTLAEIRTLANQYVNPGRMVWLVVGDAATQLEGLSKLGYGEAELLNPAVK